MDNLAEQCEEMEALKSIYDTNWNIETDTNSYSMQVSPNVKLFICLNQGYPSNAPPSFELLAPTLSSQQKQQVSDEFHEIYESNKGSPILFQWIEKLKEIVDGDLPDIDNTEIEADENVDEVKSEPKTEIYLQVTHGNIIQDRKSTFQGHVSQVKSLEDTKAFMSYLLENKKIAQATHNISAYRIVTSKGTILQDCDDDGETHAGGRVLHLLEILNATNVMVVVSRW
jgi:hypothetical protein